MPKGSAKSSKKLPPVEKRVTRRAAAAAAATNTRSVSVIADEKEPLPDLVGYIIDAFEYPDVTDILGAGPMKDLMQEFSNVAAFRAKLKDSVAPCYAVKKLKMPRTPRKLAHKIPAFPAVQPSSRVFNFDADETPANDSTIISITGKVPQTPTQKLRTNAGARFDLAEKSPGSGSAPFSYNTSAIIDCTLPINTNANSQAATQNRLLSTTAITLAANAQKPSTPAINKAGSSQRSPRTHSTPDRPNTSSRTLRALNTAPSPRLVSAATPSTDKHQIDQRLEDAEKRKQAYLRDQQERIARDNNQRKRRVDQNLAAKQQEEERKKEEHRIHHERIRQFEEAQRTPTPKTPSRFVAPAKVITPRQNAVPQKRQRPDDGVKPTEPIAKAPPTSKLPVPMWNKQDKPAEKAPEPRIEQPVEELNKTVTIEHDDEVVVEHATPAAQDDTGMQDASSEILEQHGDEVVVEHVTPAAQSDTRMEESGASKSAEQQEDLEVVEKENVPVPAPRTSIANPQMVQVKNESAYEMTPDKVFQPSSENDYNVNDLSSNDDTDDENNPRKQVPRWAEKAALRSHVVKLFKSVGKDVINAHFGVLRPPKVAELFDNNQREYGSSFLEETTAWDSPIHAPRAAPLHKHRSGKN